MADKAASSARDIAHKCLGRGAGAVAALLTLAVTIGGEATRKAIADAALAIWNDSAMLSVAALVVVAWAVAWLLTRPKGEPGGGGTVQTSHGPNSPNLAGSTFHAPVTFGPSLPAATQERKLPGRPQYHDQPSPPPPPPPPEADTPLHPLVLVRVYKKLGGVPAKGAAERAEFYRRVDCEIMDKVKLGKMHVWARSGKRALDLISEWDWQHGSLDHQRNALHIPAAYSNGYEVTDLHFDRAEVDRAWPPAPALTGRSLTHEQQALLIAELSDLSSEVSSSEVSFTDSGTESHGYYKDFFEVFTRAGLKPKTGVDIPRSPEEVGVMVIADRSTAKEPTDRLLGALRSVGVEARLIEREEDRGIDLRLYIGPQPL